ncbi:metal-dependent hydrolase [Aquimarina sp. U1-2]|uniref:metal-dependent hydrolase n=1 Tax=Aquimarina sp. U1-2 TaxID=2823141 RepID=UPI001AEC74A0|nr:metal-dependent hydrolase [Aquimarina sp. U1-2]MBP2834034.1 metal-dependent hydrolase [Aquimarina sp. U1-2]
MDSLTQIILGAAVGEATLGKKVGNKAILWGAVAGTIPDLDVLSNFFVDNVTANELHRGFSHSILFCVITAPIFGWLLSKLYKNREAGWWDWSKLMFLGLVTHPILDAFTTWGTQLFWPFKIKIAFNTISVIDPLYTLPFLACVLLTMRYKRNHPKRRKYNYLGLLISSFYLLITVILQQNAKANFVASLENKSIPFIKIQTRPTLMNSILWTANVETEDSFLIGYYSLFDKDDVIHFSEFPKNHEALADIKENSLLVRLVQLTEGWYTIERTPDNIYFNDLRFGLLGVGSKTDRFVFSYELYVDDQGNLRAREREREMANAGGLLKKLFLRILGNKT